MSQLSTATVGSASASPARQHLFLIWNFARRDLKSRFRGTTVGWAWSLILPLATVIIYTIVFSVFVRIPPPPMGNGRAGNYAVWLLVGLIPWTFMLNGINMSIPAILGNGTLLRRVYFPSYVPTVGALVAIGIQSLIEIGIVLVVLLLFLNVGVTWLLLPLWAAALAVFIGAVGYSLAVLNVFYRDVAQIVAVVMQLMFFVSAIIFPLSMVPESWHGLPTRLILELNPIAQFIVVVRELLYDLTWPSAGQVIYLLAWVVAVTGVAVWVNRRWGRDVGEFV